jgi:hypothetical protein
MAFVPTSPITGSAQTGLTAPTYTILADNAPDSNGKQFYVSALGGTQTGVTTHSVASPFTLSMFRPKVLKTLAPVNAVTGVLRSVGVNSYKVITRKGAIVLAGQAFRTANVTTEINAPAGSDLADPIELRAMLSCHIGLLTQLSNELGNSVTTGTI